MARYRFRCCSTWSAASLPRRHLWLLNPPPAAEKAPDALLLHLDNELRAAAQLIMQDVIDDFAPHIEAEIKRRMDARMERLLSQYQN